MIRTQTTHSHWKISCLKKSKKKRENCRFFLSETVADGECVKAISTLRTRFCLNTWKSRSRFCSSRNRKTPTTTSTVLKKLMIWPWDRSGRGASLEGGRRRLRTAEISSLDAVRPLDENWVIEVDSKNAN